MARARNIKPGFFQNDELGELDPLARLAFIGMWTIADFKGCIEYRPKMLKVQLLPYDECDIEGLVNSLEQARFIRFYSVQGKHYLKIVNFEKHQNPHKNEREAGSDIPDITKQDNKTNDLTQDVTKPDLIGTDRADSLLLIPDSLIPDSSIKHPSDAMSSQQAVSDAQTPAPLEKDRIPYSEIVSLYHTLMPKNPRIVDLTKTRKAQIAARWKSGALPDLASWEFFFTQCSKSDFLIGATEPKNGHKHFCPNLEWLTKEANYVKILEGKYHG